MGRIKAWAAAHTVLACAFITLAFAGAAAAAWIIFNSQYNGTVAGGFSAAGVENAVNVTEVGTATAVTPCDNGSGATCTGGNPGVIPIQYSNQTGQVENIATQNVTFATQGPGNSTCDAHLFYMTPGSLPSNIPANGSVVANLRYVADPNTPVSCQTAVINVTLSGTTSP